MTIEFTNATPVKTHGYLSVALLVLSCLFFFIPATLVVLGYYANLPTGTLISPIPQGTISNYTQPVANNPVVAAPEPATDSNTTKVQSNSSQKSAVLPANLSEISISDPEILDNSQIYLQNREDDKSLYIVKSRSLGSFVLGSNSISSANRILDYQIVNP